MPCARSSKRLKATWHFSTISCGGAASLLSKASGSRARGRHRRPPAFLELLSDPACAPSLSVRRTLISASIRSFGSRDSRCAREQRGAGDRGLAHYRRPGGERPDRQNHARARRRSEHPSDRRALSRPDRWVGHRRGGRRRRGAGRYARHGDANDDENLVDRERLAGDVVLLPAECRRGRAPCARRVAADERRADVWAIVPVKPLRGRKTPAVAGARRRRARPSGAPDARRRARRAGALRSAFGRNRRGHR